MEKRVKILEKDEAFAKELSKTLLKIAPNQSGKHGQLQEWLADIDDPDNMLFVEEWSSREEYEHHIRSDTFRIILSLIDLSDEAPLIKLNTISKTEGLEVIKEVRSAGKGF